MLPFNFHLAFVVQLFKHLFIQVTHSRDTYQDLVRLMEQHRADRAVQLSILR